MKNQKERTSMITNAAKLHGHLGPFLVIGVRMGEIAKKELLASDNQQTNLLTKAKVPLFPPYSCLLDGIQVTTTCTVGNQRLTIENSNKICVEFTRQDSGKRLKITLSSRMINELEKKLKEQALTEKYALELASVPQNQLFDLEMQ